MIIHQVQTRGCSLKGTPAEKALEDFLKNPSGNSADIEFAKTSLYAIRNDVIYSGTAVFAKGGPCEITRQRRERRQG